MMHFQCFICGFIKFYLHKKPHWYIYLFGFKVGIFIEVCHILMPILCVVHVPTSYKYVIFFPTLKISFIMNKNIILEKKKKMRKSICIAHTALQYITYGYYWHHHFILLWYLAIANEIYWNIVLMDVPAFIYS